MNELTEKYKTILLQIGSIEIKFYADTNLIYLVGEANECLASVEFNNRENNIDKAIAVLYKSAIDKGLILRVCINCKNWNPSKESMSKGNGEDYIECDKIKVQSREIVDIRNFYCNRWKEIE